MWMKRLLTISLFNNSEKLVQILLEFSQHIVESYEFVLAKFHWKRPFQSTQIMWKSFSRILFVYKMRQKYCVQKFTCRCHCCLLLMLFNANKASRQDPCVVIFVKRGWMWLYHGNYRVYVAVTGYTWQPASKHHIDPPNHHTAPVTAKKHPCPTLFCGNGFTWLSWDFFMWRCQCNILKGVQTKNLGHSGTYNTRGVTWGLCSL